MKAVFVDTGYWIAWLLPSDPLHSKVKVTASTDPSRTTITSELVLVETLNYFSAHDGILRTMAAQFILGCSEARGAVGCCAHDDACVIDPVAVGVEHERHPDRRPIVG